MKIIALRGGNSCGKTAAINLVYSTILSSGGISTCRKQEGGDIRDFSDIVHYIGRQVAFFSMADSTKPLVEAIENYYALGVDVLVCANNIGKANQIKKINKFPNSVILKTIAIPRNTVNNNIANTTDANTIFGLI